MSNETSGYRPPIQESTGGSPGTTAVSDERSTIEVTSSETGNVTGTAKEAGGRVASTAQEQAGRVAGEAKRQAGSLVSEAGTQVKEQAEGQKTKAAEGLRSLSRELQSMSDSSEQPGLAADLARQASQRTQELAEWLDQRDTGGLVEEVREFARRKPGTFLLGCAVAGVVAGRLTRGAVDAKRSDSGDEAGYRPSSPLYTDTGGYEFAGASTVADPLTDPLPTVPEAGRTGSVYGTEEPGRTSGTGSTYVSGEGLR